MEAVVRKPGAASSMDASNDDRDTTRQLVSAYVVATPLPLAFRHARMLRLPRAAGPVGLAMQLGGLALRVWSMQILGSSYTRTLRTDDQQPLVDSGPYRLVRHPGYAGSLLTWTGFGLSSRGAPVAVLVAAVMGRAYRQRIVAEEALLRRELPGYSDYSRRTTRLIPFVW